MHTGLTVEDECAAVPKNVGQDETGEVVEKEVMHVDVLKKLQEMIEEHNRQHKSSIWKREHRRDGSWQPKKARNQKSRR